MPAWQAALAAGLQFLAAAWIVRMAARLFRAQTLLSGQAVQREGVFAGVCGAVILGIGDCLRPRSGIRYWGLGAGVGRPQTVVSRQSSVADQQRKPMLHYAMRRLAYSLLLLFLVATAIFFILHLTPGSPYERIVRELAERSPQALAKIPDSHWQRLNALYALDRPIHERYFTWIANVFRGRFGETWSVAAGQSVFAVIGSRLPYTLLLMLAASLLAFILAVPLGVYSAVHQYEDADFIITTASYLGIAMPTFWFGYLLIAIFSGALNWLPYGGVASREVAAAGGDITTLFGRIFSLGLANRQIAGQEGRIFVDGVKHLILPTVTLSLLFAARWLRIVRSSILEILGQDYIRATRAKGVPERLVLLKHGLRNGLIPLITLMALDIPTLFAGSFITENVFMWPGIGRLFVDGLKGADWPLLHGLLMVNTFLIVAANLVVDLLYHVIDPRIGYADAS